MKKIVRLSERDLTKIIRRVILENQDVMEPTTPDETSELDREVQQIDYQISDPNIGSMSDMTQKTEEEGITLDQEFQKKLTEKGLSKVYEKNKQLIDSEISNFKQIGSKYDLCTRGGRKQAGREIKSKIRELIGKIKVNKKKNVNEQILPGILLGVGWILVAFLIMYWKRIIYGDNCRRWTRYKQRMVGY